MISAAERTSRIKRLSPIAAVLVAALLAFHGLTNHTFWDDEANTAIFGRNLLEFGSLTAWDGVNVIGFRTGAELSEDLSNIYMPPLQYYVAALGIAVFGETTFGGRVLFVLAGLAAIALVALFCRRFFGASSFWFLPPFLLALSPAFLLYIRNCRYYSLSALLFVSMLAALSSDLETRRSRVWAYSLAISSALLLPFAHYLNAAGALASLPLFLALKRFRTKRHLTLLGAIYGASLVVGAYLLTTANPLGAGVQRTDPSPPLDRFFTLLWWHLRDLGIFEFVPVTLTAVLILPFVVPKVTKQKDAARCGLIVVGIVAVNCLVTALFSPQPLEDSNVADMRHLVPMITLGACLGGIALFILWNTSRTLSAAVGCVLVFSNILHLGFLGQPSGFLNPKPIGCTLCDYISENANDYTTSTETLIDVLKDRPKDSVVFVYPPYMAYSPMFYLPELHFCCQLNLDKNLSPELRSELPDYVYWEKAKIDFALISANPPPVRRGPLDITFRGKKYDMGTFHLLDYINVFREDRSRPEIPWHSFSPEEFEDVPRRHGFFVADITR